MSSDTFIDSSTSGAVVAAWVTFIHASVWVTAETSSKCHHNQRFHLAVEVELVAAVYITRTRATSSTPLRLDHHHSMAVRTRTTMGRLPSYRNRRTLISHLR